MRSPTPNIHQEGFRVKKLSARQQIILEFLESFIDEHGYPPTVRDIQHGCSISSTSVVDYNLRHLEREGYINRDPDVSRGIGLTEGSYGRRDNMVSLPVLGYIAAGTPIPVPTAEGWASSEPLDNVDVPSYLTGGRRDVYALKVKGFSMIDALIDEGDVVVLEPIRQAQNNDMVAAVLTDTNEVTLKRFHAEGARVRLQPANSQMEPIYVDADKVEVHGRVVAVLRIM